MGERPRYGGVDPGQSLEAAGIRVYQGAGGRQKLGGISHASREGPDLIMVVRDGWGSGLSPLWEDSCRSPLSS